MIAGGRGDATFADGTYSKTLTVVMPDGRQCSEYSLPQLPKQLEAFGMASRKNRYMYVCGGIERSDSKGEAFC